MKPFEKGRAIALRKQGKSYSEILSEIPVAKSTLSLWLHDVGLAKTQRQGLTRKRLDAVRRGGEARRRQKEDAIRIIKSASRSEIGTLSERERWLIGAALYWGEGSKEKAYRPGTGLVFNNSDPVMTRFYVRWLIQVLKVPQEKIHFSLYIHETKRHELEQIRKYWSAFLGISADAIAAVYFKKGKILTVRRNTGVLYYGTMRVKVPMSSALNRRVTGWIEGIGESK